MFAKALNVLRLSLKFSNTYKLFSGLLTFVNSYNVRITTRFQNVFILILAIALASILLAGIVWIVSGSTYDRKMSVLRDRKSVKANVIENKSSMHFGIFFIISRFVYSKFSYF